MIEVFLFHTYSLLHFTDIVLFSTLIWRPDKVVNDPRGSCMLETQAHRLIELCHANCVRLIEHLSGNVVSCLENMESSPASQVCSEIQMKWRFTVIGLETCSTTAASCVPTTV